MAQKLKIRGLRRDRALAARLWLQRIIDDDAKAAPKNAKTAKVKIFDQAVAVADIETIKDAVDAVIARLDDQLAKVV